jgi:hypothetical protein
MGQSSPPNKNSVWNIRQNLWFIPRMSFIWARAGVHLWTIVLVTLLLGDSRIH